VIERQAHVAALESRLRQFPVVAILGARQVGKTTLAGQLVARRRGPATRFDLESAEDLALLADPLLALRPLEGLIVIDEVQRRPDLFPVLRVLADEPRGRRRFLVLGSASPDLLRQSSESLAGRIAYHELGGFSPEEVGTGQSLRLWCRGGFPRSFLARSDSASLAWRRELVRTYLERDIPALGLRLPAGTLRRFWMMLAHYHGRVWNASEFGRAFGVAHTTVARYLDVLTDTFMARQLPPWHENIGKRQVKAPKVYIRDSGLLHALLGLARPRAPAACSTRCWGSGSRVTSPHTRSSGRRGKGSPSVPSCRVWEPAPTSVSSGPRTRVRNSTCWSSAGGDVSGSSSSARPPLASRDRCTRQRRISDCPNCRSSMRGSDRASWRRASRRWRSSAC